MENAKPAYLKQDKTGRVYPFTEALAGRKDMRPCASPEQASQDADTKEAAFQARVAALPARDGMSLHDYLAMLQNRQIQDYMQSAYGATVQAGKKEEMIARALEAVGEGQ